MALVHDWNATDAVHGAPRLPVGARIRMLLSSPRSALRALDLVPAGGNELTRARNLVTGLGERAGARVPELQVYRGAPNAVVVPGNTPVVAIADGALDELSRTELEAVLAHCVVRIALSRRSDMVGYADDVRAAALTRYPPGLAKALAKLIPRAGTAAHWFTAADAPSHRPLPERIAALEEL